MTNKGINPDEFDPEYQTGKKTVTERNLDASGDDHPLGSDPLSFEAENMQVLIRDFADGQYQSWEATIREYLANSETACLRVDEAVEEDTEIIADESYQPTVEVDWDRNENRLRIKDNGVGMASKEVDRIFRMVGNSANRDSGQYSGQFGMGALSFVKLIGLDNSMLMTTHSRWTDENFSAYVSLSGPEPIMGKLDDDEYGTVFEMTPKTDDDGSVSFNIRNAVERYAKYMRVPVLYREFDESGEEVFNEDWGDLRFEDQYSEAAVVPIEREYFRAVASPDATGETLLLSMPIDRNDESENGTRQAPFPFDVRLLDESGTVIESTNGNEGLMPCPASDYDDMLLQAREDAIPPYMLTSRDGLEGSDGPVTIDEIDDPVGREVVVGPKSGRTVVSEDEWDEMPAGRAEHYVPETELEDFDPETGQGDLALPEPTTDRDRLRSHETFWKWLSMEIQDEVNARASAVYEETKGMSREEAFEHLMSLDPQDFSIALNGKRSGTTEWDTVGSEVIELVDSEVFVVSGINPQQVEPTKLRDLYDQEVVTAISTPEDVYRQCEGRGIKIAVGWDSENDVDPRNVFGWEPIETRFDVSSGTELPELPNDDESGDDDEDDEESFLDKVREALA